LFCQGRFAEKTSGFVMDVSGYAIGGAESITDNVGTPMSDLQIDDQMPSH
jgi:hypothetical protein